VGKVANQEKDIPLDKMFAFGIDSNDYFLFVGDFLIRRPANVCRTGCFTHPRCEVYGECVPTSNDWSGRQPKNDSKLGIEESMTIQHNTTHTSFISSHFHRIYLLFHSASIEKVDKYN
jgi:hypothetical protein